MASVRFATQSKRNSTRGTIASGRADPLGEAASSQLFLDALPIAAAIIDEKAGRRSVLASNALYQDLDKPLFTAKPDSLLQRLGIEEVIDHFLAGPQDSLELTLEESDPVFARHFIVRLARIVAGEGGRHSCLISLIDRTAQVKTERSLRAEMLHDSLTGLPNRVAFGEKVETAIDLGGRDEGFFAVLVIDLTRFGRINECIGSMAGDELIITVARRLVAGLRSGDVLARIGGNEFGILLRLKDGPGDALHAANRIRATLSTPFRLSNLEIRIDCAIGCGYLNDRVNGAEDLIRNAQFAMKRAKVSGQVEVYKPGEVQVARDRFSLETELRRAIDADRLALAYQPLINLETNAVEGFEALARWKHPEGGAISPTDFIPVAEESGLIVPLGRWALSAATRELALWDKAAGQRLPIYVAVNVSAVQLQRDDIVSAVVEALSQSGLTGDRLKLELTESCIVADPDRAMRVIRALRDRDVRIAMDDFGTGYSSLAYLQQLPIDGLKIDRSFVTPMLADRDSLAIVRAVLSLADALGMRTTAEGVETVELAQTLAALGCHCAQGFHFAKPLPPDEALAYLLARRA